MMLRTPILLHAYCYTMLRIPILLHMCARTLQHVTHTVTLSHTCASCYAYCGTCRYELLLHVPAAASRAKGVSQGALEERVRVRSQAQAGKVDTHTHTHTHKQGTKEEDTKEVTRVQGLRTRESIAELSSRLR